MPRQPRRRFLQASAAVLATLPFERLATAQAPALSAPQVDTLVLRIITDSSYDTPRPGKNPHVRVKRSPFISQRDWKRALHNEWGLAMALESRIGGDTRRLLLDAGYTAQALINNMDVIGIDGTQMHALIVSHGHYDHFGGLVGYLEKHRDKLPADLVLYAGGEENFCIRKTQSGSPGHFSDWGVLDRRDLERLRVKVVTCERPTVVQGHAFTTGIIARRSFERVLPNTMVEFARRDGVGCDMPEAHAKAQGKPAPDEHLHEHGTCFHVKGKGLVVISSCGHAGIVNTVLQAQEVSGVKKVHAVLGGFHLFPAPDDYLRRTVAELKALDPDVVVPLHCSGPGFVDAMRAMLGDRLVTSTTGTEFTFGA
jgi:7,8-dihydropterin-6-yl-methyl-4-(beta-D-ribofuranosyl)aminobenzene 5'-phosphate synthase